MGQSSHAEYQIINTSRISPNHCGKQGSPQISSMLPRAQYLPLRTTDSWTPESMFKYSHCNIVCNIKKEENWYLKVHQ